MKMRKCCISAFPHFRISAFPHFRISAFPHFRISAFPHFRILLAAKVQCPAEKHHDSNYRHAKTERVPDRFAHITTLNGETVREDANCDRNSVAYFFSSRSTIS